MNEWWLLQSERFSALSRKDKYSVLIMGIAVVIVLFYFVSYQSFLSKKTSVQEQIAFQQSDNEQLQGDLTNALERLEQNPNNPVSQQIEQQQRQLDKLDYQLLALTTDLMSPKNMRKALVQILALKPGVKLLSLNALPVEQLTVEQLAPVDATSPILYRHSLDITLEGRYFQLRDYLEMVEGLPWRLQWQNFEYQVIAYPKAKLQLRLYSLSSNKEFIGV
ncbi:hypothetical protein [Thalassotalea aquiviva]|uniref:hypothetical protein n=1 Tax=Thalassotalea aquiviva TaxID=3242415 RepID=UPI00352B0A67